MINKQMKKQLIINPTLTVAEFAQILKGK